MSAGRQDLTGCGGNRRTGVANVEPGELINMPFEFVGDRDITLALALTVLGARRGGRQVPWVQAPAAQPQPLDNMT